MTMNFLVLLISSLVPSLIGFIYYHPKVLGTIWMKESGLTEETLKGTNMPLVMFLSLLLGLFLASALNNIVIHQNNYYSILVNEPGFNVAGSEINTMFTDFIAKYGKNFRTFKHGVLHGSLSGFFIALPILGINALFERKSFKYIAIHTGYWMLTMGIMGGIICQFS
jgi:hypothetical protein